MTKYIALTAFLVALWGNCSETTTEEKSRIPEGLEGVELYDWLGYEGIFDEELSNRDVHELIERGILHKDQEVQIATLGALFWYIHSEYSLGKWQLLNPSVLRHLEIIPGLKKFLMDTFEQGRLRHPEVHLYEKQHTMEVLLELEWIKRNGRLALSVEWAWKEIPLLLAAIFPRDPDVLELVWPGSNSLSDQQIKETNCGLLHVLNIGNFATDAVNSLRIRCLMENDLIYEATKGLAVCQTDSGFEALISWLDVPNEYMYHRFSGVLEAISSYGTKALPYAPRLKQMASNLGLLLEPGELVERPSMYEFDPNEGEKYRVHQSLQRLDRLERRYGDKHTNELE